MKKSNLILIVFAVVATLLVAAPDMFARRNKTTRNTGKEPSSAVTHSETPKPVACDTLLQPADAVVLSGYDKPLRATSETIFLSNNLPSDICKIALTIAYFDTQGRELHRRSLSRYVDIPAGSTRRINFPSWDKQKSFYYVGSAKPRQGNPYTVSMRVDTIFTVITDNE